MGRVTIDIKDKSKEKSFINFLKDIPFIEVKVNKIKNDNKKKDIEEFKKIFGIWKGRDINLNNIRKVAWRK